MDTLREPERGQKHEMCFCDRTNGHLTGVLDVFSFNENEILLATTEGMMTIKGKELHVSRLCLEKGEVDVEGRVESLLYSEGRGKLKKDRNLLARLFR